MSELTDCPNPKQKLADELGIDQRKPSEEFEDHHRDLAFEIQRLVEEMVLVLVEYNYERTGQRKIAVAGD